MKYVASGNWATGFFLANCQAKSKLGKRRRDLYMLLHLLGMSKSSILEIHAPNLLSRAENGMMRSWSRTPATHFPFVSLKKYMLPKWASSQTRPLPAIL